MSFTTKDVLDTAMRIGKENPDFIYTKQDGYDFLAGCGYAGNAPGSFEGTPCIVGSALLELGVEAKSICASTSIASSVVMAYADDDGEDWENLHRLDLLQSEQDMGIPWGSAVEEIELIIKRENEEH